MGKYHQVLLWTLERVPAETVPRRFIPARHFYTPLSKQRPVRILPDPVLEMELCMRRPVWEPETL
jgi:hypothetical protein